jgi:hypothetical protein
VTWQVDELASKEPPVEDILSPHPEQPWPMRKPELNLGTPSPAHQTVAVICEEDRPDDLSTKPVVPLMDLSLPPPTLDEEQVASALTIQDEIRNGLSQYGVLDMVSNATTELSATSAAVSTMVNDLSGLCSRIDETHKRDMEDKTKKYLLHEARNLSHHTKSMAQSQDKVLPILTKLSTTVKNLDRQPPDHAHVGHGQSAETHD